MARGYALEASDAVLTAASGTYALGLHLPETIRCTIGALGEWKLPAGLYVYVGSAWGPGGLAARVGRHLRGGTVRRWHIDYARPWMRPVMVWVAQDKHLECDWAHYLLNEAGARVIVPRFGASDCHCPAHLLYFDSQSPEAVEFLTAALPGVTGCFVP